MKIKNLRIKNCDFSGEIKFNDYEISFADHLILLDGVEGPYILKFLQNLCESLNNKNNTATNLIHFIKPINKKEPIEINLTIESDNDSSYDYTAIIDNKQLFSETIYDIKNKKLVYCDRDETRYDNYVIGHTRIFYDNEIGVNFQNILNNVNYIDDENVITTNNFRSSLKDLLEYYSNMGIDENLIIEYLNNILPGVDSTITGVSKDGIKSGTHLIPATNSLEYFGSGICQLSWQLPVIIESIKNNKIGLIKNFLSHSHVLLYKHVIGIITKELQEGQLIATHYRFY